MAYLKCSKRYFVTEERFLVSLCCGVAIGLQSQLTVIWAVGRDHGDPTYGTHWNIVFYSEAKHLGVELESFRLIINQEARQLDLHAFNLKEYSCSAAYPKLRKLEP